MLAGFVAMVPCGTAIAHSTPSTTTTSGGTSVTSTSGGTSTTATPAPTTPAATPGPPVVPTGGSQYGIPQPEPTVPGIVAKILPGGLAAAPADAPLAVQQAIWAANGIVGLPYIFGGGHASFIAKGYDCSGTVSFALHGANLLSKPYDSSDFMRWGAAGPGTWITVYTNPGHAYMTIAGIRLDTSKAGDPHGQDGPRWRPLLRSSAGFKVRHPLGY
jgi:cell wall-associated NlpC family hydrolase